MEDEVDDDQELEDVDESHCRQFKKMLSMDDPFTAAGGLRFKLEKKSKIVLNYANSPVEL